MNLDGFAEFFKKGFEDAEGRPLMVGDTVQLIDCWPIGVYAVVSLGQKYVKCYDGCAAYAFRPGSLRHVDVPDFDAGRLAEQYAEIHSPERDYWISGCVPLLVDDSGKKSVALVPVPRKGSKAA